MSHILDALRQAEDERRLGQPPGRSAIASPLRAARRQRGPLLAWVIVALLLAGLAVVMWVARTPQTAQTTADEIVARPPLPVQQSSGSASDTMPESPSVTPPVDEPTETAPKQAAPEAASATAQEEGMPRAQLAEADRIDSLDALFQPSAARPQAAGDRSDAPLQPTDIFQESDAASGANAKGDTASADTASGPRNAREQASEWSELPRASSVGMPTIDIDVHVYNDNPDRRFVLINGQRRVEGDALDNGAVIDSIAPDGLVLEWRGMRVARPLSR